MKNKVFTALFLLLGTPVYAAGNESRDPAVAYVFWFSMHLIFFVLWLALVYSELNDNQGKLFWKPFIYLKDKLSNATPLENEKDILLDHDYDGIKELGNPVPPWFNFLFYGTIIFGIAYVIYFHVLGGPLQTEEYMAEMEQAQLQKEILIKSGVFVNEDNVTLLSDAGALASGKEIFVKNCASCHGNAGEGLVGPNLTDDYWIHGGGIKNVFKTIKYGVPSKGMISWQTQLGPKQIQEVASFVLSLHGTNPPNGKAPEGEKYIGDEGKTETNI